MKKQKTKSRAALLREARVAAEQFRILKAQYESTAEDRNRLRKDLESKTLYAASLQNDLTIQRRLVEKFHDHEIHDQMTFANDPFAAVNIIENWNLNYRLANCIGHIERFAKRDIDGYRLKDAFSLKALLYARWFLQREIEAQQKRIAGDKEKEQDWNKTVQAVRDGALITKIPPDLCDKGMTGVISFDCAKEEPAKKETRDFCKERTPGWHTIALKRPNLTEPKGRSVHAKFLLPLMPEQKKGESNKKYAARHREFNKRINFFWERIQQTPFLHELDREDEKLAGLQNELRDYYAGKEMAE